METLVVLPRHRNQFYNPTYKSQGSADFGSSPSKGFRDINCRGFESGMGLLPTPLKDCFSSQPIDPLPSPKTPTPSAKTTTLNPKSENISTPMKKGVVSSPIPINLNGGKKLSPWMDGISSFEFGAERGCSSLPAPNVRSKGGKKKSVRGDSFCSERWAGPTYSNSPPPSCLPIPKFSMRPKRTVSLELPPLETDFSLPSFAKSAPASPTRETSCSPTSVFLNDDSATKTLRRILNLNVCDD